MAKRGDSSTLCWRFIHFYGRYSKLSFSSNGISACFLLFVESAFKILRFLAPSPPLGHWPSFYFDYRSQDLFTSIYEQPFAYEWGPKLRSAFCTMEQFFQTTHAHPLPQPYIQVQPVSFPDIQHCIGWKGGTAKHLINNSTALGSYSKTNGMNVPGSFCPGLSELLVVLVLYFSTLS